MSGRGTDHRTSAGTEVGAVLLWLALSVVGGAARAQEADFGPQSPEATELTLREDPELPSGRTAVIEGTADRTGSRFRLGELSVLQPVMVSVLARDDDADLRLSLLKPGDGSARLSASTEGQGHAILYTRTQGPLDLLVEGPDAAVPFALFVWVSDEVTPPLADVVVGPGQAGSSRPEDGDGFPVPFVLLATLAGGGLVGAAALLMRRRHG